MRRRRLRRLESVLCLVALSASPGLTALLSPLCARDRGSPCVLCEERFGRGLQTGCAARMCDQWRRLPAQRCATLPPCPRFSPVCLVSVCVLCGRPSADDSGARHGASPWHYGQDVQPQGL